MLKKYDDESGKYFKIYFLLTNGKKVQQLIHMMKKEKVQGLYKL